MPARRGATVTAAASADSGPGSSCGQSFRSASTIPLPDGDSGRRVRDRGRPARPRRGPPSSHRDNERAVPAWTGERGRAGMRAAGQVRAGVGRRACTPQRGEDPDHGLLGVQLAARAASAFRLAPAAASTSCGAACRRRRSRPRWRSSRSNGPAQRRRAGAGIPVRLAVPRSRLACGAAPAGPPDAARSNAAREASSARASAAAAGTGMRDWTGNGASRFGKRSTFRPGLRPEGMAPSGQFG